MLPELASVEQLDELLIGFWGLLFGPDECCPPCVFQVGSREKLVVGHVIPLEGVSQNPTPGAA